MKLSTRPRDEAFYDPTTPAQVDDRGVGRFTRYVEVDDGVPQMGFLTGAAA